MSDNGELLKELKDRVCRTIDEASERLIAEVGAAAALGLKAALEGAQEGVPVQVQL